EEVRQGPGPRAQHVLHRQALQPGGHLPEAAGAVRGGLLTVLNRRNEVRAHIHAALNVGASRREVTEVIFQQVTYGGMPVVVEALEVFKEVLQERGEWTE